MPALLAHAFAGGVVCGILTRCRRWTTVGAALACIPDLDAVTHFGLGLPNGALVAHRGLLHSIPFALVTGIGAGMIGRDSWSLRRTASRRTIAFSVAVGSHGLLDAVSASGAGVMLMAPFSTALVASPWRLIDTSAAVSSADGLALKTLVGLTYETTVVAMLATGIAASFWVVRRLIGSLLPVFCVSILPMRGAFGV